MSLSQALNQFAQNLGRYLASSLTANSYLILEFSPNLQQM